MILIDTNTSSISLEMEIVFSVGLCKPFDIMKQMPKIASTVYIDEA